MRRRSSRKFKQTQRKLKTDIGTVLLHWIAVLAVFVNLATGLAIAADAPSRTWLHFLRGLLPQGEVWRLHIVSGVVLLAVAIAYAIYLHRSGLTRRISLDKARIYALRIKGRARWGTINVILYWVVFGLLILQLVTGGLLYAGYGGSIVTVHFWAAVLIFLYPVVHVIAQYCYGHVQQVLRILAPGPLIHTARPPTLAELVRRHLERTSDVARSSSRSTLNLHPLTAAFAAALGASAFVAALDQTVRDTLAIHSIKPAEAPVLDGDIADPVWRKAGTATIETQQGANFGGRGATTVTVRAVHDGTWVYLAFTWDDPTRSMKHLPLIKRADGWHLLHTRYDIEDEDSYYEDKFAVMLADSHEMPAAGSVHLGPRPLADKPAAMSGRGLHYTADGSIVDVWHWKAARGGLLGGVDDNHFGPPKPPTEAESAGKSRYKAGYQTDPGKAAFASNFDSQPPGGYSGPLQPKRLPKDLAALAKAMGPVNLDPETSEPVTARWWMTAEESEPYAPEADKRIPVGTVIPGVVINGDYAGDRGDVRCGARWAAGRWTLEIARRLDTSSKHDVAIRTGTAMWVAAFDHSQTRHTRHMRPVRLEVKQ